MSDANTPLKVGEHHIHETAHPHAYKAIERMSPELQHQLFTHVQNHNSAVFTAEVHGKMKEYRLDKDGMIHEHHA